MNSVVQTAVKKVVTQDLIGLIHTAGILQASSVHLQIAQEPADGHMMQQITIVVLQAKQVQ